MTPFDAARKLRPHRARLAEALIEAARATGAVETSEARALADRLMAVLDLYAQGEDPEEESARRLVEAQEQTARANERARELQQANDALKRSETQSQHRADQLALLATVMKRVAGILDPERLMQTAAEIVRAERNYTFVAIVVLDDEGVLVGRWAGRDGVSRRPFGRTQGPARGVIGRALGKKAPQVVKDVSQDKVYHADVPPGNIPLTAIEALRRNPLVRQVIPLALGDSFRGFRIVGTEPSLLTHYGATFARGKAWAAPMEAVLGSDVARIARLDVGATFTGSHGLEAGGGEHAAEPYRVVGVLAPTHRVIDRLILTGIETLPLRMAKHCENALAVATYLAEHPQVDWVNYAGLPANPYHALARKICPKGAGSVFTFGLKGGYEAGVRLVSNVRLLSHLANIGDVRSLIIHPASTTHRQLTDEQRAAAGAGDDVVRLSVGLEDAADIIADLDQALAP